MQNHVSWILGLYNPTHQELASVFYLRMDDFLNQKDFDDICLKLGYNVGSLLLIA